MPVEKLTPERRRQLTRNALIDAAAQLFAEKGFHGAALEEIAEAAGFSRGAIYSNFGSKEELLVAVLDRFNDRQLENFAEAMDSDDPMGSALSAGAVFKQTRSLELVPLELELRLNALRNPQVRKRLAEAERGASEKTARFIEQNVLGSGVRLKIPARDLGDIGRAAVLGLIEYAAVDEQEAERYEQLVESLFVLLAEAAFERDENG
jgi:AcrR family transcriptional regulator